jgi:hypothetical protein
MKVKFILTLALAASMTVFSQNEENNSMADWSPEVYQVGKKYPGYIIKLDGDTIQGFLKADSRCSSNGMGSSNQNRAEFYLKETDRKPADKYKPDDIKGYKIADKVYESINYSGGMFKKANFNLVVEDGAIRLYEWYSTVENFSMLSRQSGETWQAFDGRRYIINLIVAKDPTEPIDFSMLGLSFKKKMPPLIEDNADMAQKVADKEKGYTFLNAFEVIKEYNAWAAANK